LTASLASNVLIAVLQGLQLHGQHEANQVSVDRQN
jgi:exportin-5